MHLVKPALTLVLCCIASAGWADEYKFLVNRPLMTTMPQTTTHDGRCDQDALGNPPSAALVRSEVQKRNDWLEKCKILDTQAKIFNFRPDDDGAWRERGIPNYPLFVHDTPGYPVFSPDALAACDSFPPDVVYFQICSGSALAISISQRVLLNEATNRCLSIGSGQETVRGAPVIAQGCDGSERQIWSLTEDGYLVNQLSGMCATVAEESETEEEDSKPVQQSRQSRRPVRRDLGGSGMRVVQDTCNFANDPFLALPRLQQWDGANDDSLQNRMAKRCLEIQRQPTSGRAPTLEVWECRHNQQDMRAIAPQRWKPT